jgi:hypothetical protein
MVLVTDDVVDVATGEEAGAACAVAACVNACSKLANSVIACTLPPEDSLSPSSSRCRCDTLTPLKSVERLSWFEPEIPFVDIILPVEKAR